jgi:hypothetical protein
MIAPWLERLVATLIRLHPRDFAAEYAADMIETVRARAANARRRGRTAFTTFVLRELVGLIASALTQHLAFRRSSGSVGVEGEHARMQPLRELRYAARRLRRTPVFAVAATLTLGLAIAAHTAVFTLVQRVVIAPLPYPAAERLIALDHTAPGMGLRRSASIVSTRSCRPSKRSRSTPCARVRSARMAIRCAPTFYRRHRR